MSDRRSGAHQHLVARLIEILSRHLLAAEPDREERGLVHQVRELGAREARRAAGDLAEVDIGPEEDLPRVNLKNLETALHVGRAHRHLPVEAPGPQQRRIEDIRPVGGRDDDDAVVGHEAVHLDEQLVERLLALLVAQRVAAAAPANGVELVDEDDARGMTAGVAEHLTDARRTDAGIHLDEIGSARKQKRHVGFTGDRAREKRLAGARRSDQQNTLGNATANGGEATGLAQEIDDLLDLFLRFVDTGDVGERGDARLLVGLTRPALESQNTTRRGAIQREPEDREKPGAEQNRAVVVGRLFRRRPHVDAHAFADELGYERRVRRHVVGRRGRPHHTSVVERDPQLVALDHHLRDHAAIEVAQQIGKSHLRDHYGAAGAHHRGSGAEKGGDHPRGNPDVPAAGPFTRRHVMLRFRSVRRKRRTLPLVWR